VKDDISDDVGFDPSGLRAEDALRDSLARDRGWSSERVETAPVRRRVRRRSRLRIAGAALAVVVVAGGVATGVELGSGGSDRSVGPTTLTPPDNGWRWDFYRDIRIQVPASWDYGQEPSSDWCVGGGRWLADAPYIDLSSGRSVLAIGCPSTDGSPGFSNEPPTDLWAVHVRLSALNGDGDASVSQRDGWWIVKQPVGHVLVKAVGEDRSLLDQIVASATAVADDSGGCFPSSPIQESLFPRPTPPFDVAELSSVDSITVCEYDVASSGPGLIGAYRMTGADADAELRALRSASVGGGPDRPQNCYPDDPGENAFELRLASGADVHTMYVFYSSCVGNGFDDGTHLRELTVEACMPLVREPVALTGGSSASFERCYPSKD
jgi:hypothetical protein